MSTPVHNYCQAKGASNQQFVFDYYREAIKSKGFAPTMAECGRAGGMHWASVQRHVLRLSIDGAFTPKELDVLAMGGFKQNHRSCKPELAQFAANFQRLRHACGKSNEQVADEMGGMHFTSASHWGRGVSAPNAQYIPRLARVLNCCVSDLFEGMS